MWIAYEIYDYYKGFSPQIGMINMNLVEDIQLQKDKNRLNITTQGYLTHFVFSTPDKAQILFNAFKRLIIDPDNVLWKKEGIGTLRVLKRTEIPYSPPYERMAECEKVNTVDYTAHIRHGYHWDNVDE